MPHPYMFLKEELPRLKLWGPPHPGRQSAPPHPAAAGDRICSGGASLDPESDAHGYGPFAAGDAPVQCLSIQGFFRQSSEAGYGE